MSDFLTELVPASKKDVFARYFQFYLCEHAAFTGDKPLDGIFQYAWLDAYWREEEARWPFWMRRTEDVVALALLRLDDEDAHYEVAEFFVVDRYRGQGLGDGFARDIILRFEGRWKISQVKRNKRAIAFWRRVLGEFTDYAEAPLLRDDGIERVEQRFVV